MASAASSAELDLARVSRGLHECQGGVAQSVSAPGDREIADVLGLEQPLRVAASSVDVPDQGWQAAEHEHHGQRLVVIVLRGDERRQECAERVLRFSRGVEHGVSFVQQERQAPAPRKTADLA